MSIPDKKMKMLASPFYHNLHIVQLKVMHRLTGKGFFTNLRTLEGTEQSPQKNQGASFTSRSQNRYY